ncbi:hypothetical protein C7S20_05640 [Christiangramia fulva]|uniref:Uncharacterized protein n=1 Tax=Christiangramia fulva TaxID=2126553 RepID=A0A2R3Z3D8_9FLAO|nr:hypothetical protein [Christiangramia fulva]AVR44790.1 hypothetical protein C7S20_05640 [Christiangramia fulva]
MKNNETRAHQILKYKGKEIIKYQLDRLIFGPGRNSYSYFGNFLEVANELHGWHYWYLLRTAYECADGIFIYREEVRESFIKNEPEKSSLMSAYEKRYLKSLGPIVQIYRGMTKTEAESGDFGVSWTLSLKKAEAFAFEYSRVHGTPEERIVLSLDIKVSDVIAYFSGSEREIIYIHNPEE